MQGLVASRASKEVEAGPAGPATSDNESSQMPLPSADVRERDYVAHRDDVLAMLRAKFPGVPEHDEIYQEAWAEALEREARGHDLTDPGGLLRTIAWRRARDWLRQHRTEALDPTSSVFNNRSDPSVSPAEEVELRVEAAVIQQVVESLDERHAAVIKLRFERHMSSREIQEALGLKPKRLENIVTEAYKLVELALTASAEGETLWRRRQRSLLVACETGLASVRQRRQAQRMVADDPACRAMLGEIRSALRDVAAVLPMPVFVADRADRLRQMRIGLTDRLAAVREHLADAGARVAGHGPNIEQVSSGGIAGLGGGVAVKAALVCIAVTGSTVVCIESGILGTHHPKPRPGAHARHHPVKPPRTPTVRIRASEPPTRTAAAQRRQQRGATSNASAPPAPSPAPTGSTEFGPGSVGSAPTTRVAAAAPTGGGGEFAP